MDTPIPTTGDLQRLAQAVWAERDAQGASQRVMAQRADMSPLTWISVEKAKAPPRPTTLSGIDRGLGWPEGTAAAVLEGGDPPELGSETHDKPTASPPSAALDRLDEVIERQTRMESMIERQGRQIAALLALAVKDSDGPR